MMDGMRVICAIEQKIEILLQFNYVIVGFSARCADKLST